MHFTFDTSAHKMLNVNSVSYFVRYGQFSFIVMLMSFCRTQWWWTISLLITVELLCRQIVILMPNQWLCFWVNIPLGKRHSLSICSKVVIQASYPLCVRTRMQERFRLKFIYMFYWLSHITVNRSSHWTWTYNRQICCRNGICKTISFCVIT